MVTLVYLVYKSFPLFDFCISQHLCHFILEAFLKTIPLKMLVQTNLFCLIAMNPHSKLV